MLQKLFKETDIASLAFFRIAFGAIMCWEVCRYFLYDWVESQWIDQSFFFTYNLFHWLEPLPKNGLYVLFFFLGLAAVFICIGLFYRIATVFFFFGFSYIFLLEKSHYLNHFYLIVLLSFLLIFLPAHKKFSIDSLLKPSLKKDKIPLWALFAIQLQISVAYFFGGIAKLNADWIAGEPMRMWLAKTTDFPIIGKYFVEEFMVYFFIFGGLILDLFIVPFLFWKKTRKLAFVTICLFHLFNSQLFKIGIFPWFMIAATTIYFEADWCKNLLKRIFNQFDNKNQSKIQFNKWAAYAFIFYFLIQIIAPLRHYAIPGNVNWTERGHRFAWHMKLRTKRGKAYFIVVDNSSKNSFVENPRKRLSARQTKKMSGRPDMIWQYAHYLEKIYMQKGYKNISVFANVEASLNGRKNQRLVDKNYNLLQDKYYNEFNVEWIIPLTTPLKDKTK